MPRFAKVRLYRTHMAWKDKLRSKRHNPERSTSDHIVGRNIVAVCTRHQSRHEQEFARDRSDTWRTGQRQKESQGGECVSPGPTRLRSVANAEWVSRLSFSASSLGPWSPPRRC